MEGDKPNLPSEMTTEPGNDIEYKTVENIPTNNDNNNEIEGVKETESIKAINQPSKNEYALPGTSKAEVLNPSTKEDLLIGSGPSHVAGGVKSSLHGTIYQVKLAMFFIIRALIHGFKFNIGSEVDKAGEYDDLVFNYENSDKKGIVFLQAKHRHDEEKTVREIDLMNKTGHFSLPKYYASFLKILEDAEFKKILKDTKGIFVITTNIKIDSTIKDYFEEITEGEFSEKGFLHPGTAAEYAKYFKIAKETPFYETLIPYLEQNELPLQLAEHIAKTVANNKNKSIKIDNQFKRYKDWLIDRIFDHGTDVVRKQNFYYVTFKDSFLTNRDRDLAEFRQKFEEVFMKEQMQGKDKKNVTISDLLDVKYKVPKDFIVSVTVTENKAVEFVDSLVFAFNQPSENKLGDIVEQEVGEYTGLADRKSMACKFQTFILDWIKQKEGRFLTKIDVEQRFAVWGQTDLSHKAVNEIRSTGYLFEKDKVNDICEFLITGDEQILCLYYTDRKLTEIKLTQALDEGVSSSNCEFIFSDINTLSDQVNTKICPIKAFNTPSCNNSFVIIKKQSQMEQKEERLLRRLIDIVKTDIQNGLKYKGKQGKTKKRLVIIIPLDNQHINERNDYFSKIDADGIQRKLIEDTKVKFSDLTDESKIQLYKNGVLKILGDNIGASVLEKFNDPSLPSIVNALKDHVIVKGKPLNAHIEKLQRNLSGIVKDEVLSVLLTGKSKKVADRYDQIMNKISRGIADDTLSTIIQESRRIEMSDDETMLSVLINGLSFFSSKLETRLED